MEAALVMAGVACIIAAIIGGGVKLVQVELGPVASLWRQMLLGGFGIILVLAGLVAGGQVRLGMVDPAAPAPANAVKNDSPVSNTAVARPADTTPPDTAAPDKVAPSQVPASTAPANPPSDVALPGKVDIFWCESDDGGSANQALAQKVAPALSATGRIGQVRVRMLSLTTNAQPDYQIRANIARFDPGEQPAAAAIAQIASQASGTGFAPAPALPGTPSINYISVFVCAPN